MLSSEWFMKKVSVLDGALSTELERRGFSFLQDPLWSARILQIEPKAVIDVHESYLEARADIITTCSYQATIPGFQKHLNLTVEEGRKLIKLSVELARKAIDRYEKGSSDSKQKCLIAGSVGPYCAAFADGSEYTGSHCNNISLEALIEWHRPRIECLVEAGVDLLAFETIPALKEGEALMKLLREFPGTKAWLSFSSNSLHETSHGEDIATAAQTCLKSAPSSQLVAIGINCCPPENTESLLKDISASCPNFPLIAYPNSGEIWSFQNGWSGKKTMSRESFVQSWVNAGAKIIGGCCRTTPEDTSKIYEIVNKL